MIAGRHKTEAEERSRIIRQDFYKRYNLEELREQLYREQEGICAICRKLMQDSCSVICAVDHAISIYIHASAAYSVEEACDYANVRKNLVAAHALCNSVKNAQDLEEFYEKIESGEIVLGEVPTLSEAQIQKRMDQLSEIGRKGGHISGRKHAESGLLFRICVSGGRVAGREAAERGQIQTLGHTQGRKNVESGHLASISTLENCSKGGRKVVDSGQLASIRAAGSRAAGRKAVESGQLARMLSLPQTKEARRQTGLIRGRKNVDSGQIQALGRKNVENGHLASVSSKGGRYSGHIRYHFNRGISKPDTCALCAAEAGNIRNGK